MKLILYLIKQKVTGKKKRAKTPALSMSDVNNFFFLSRNANEILWKW